MAASEQIQDWRVTVAVFAWVLAAGLSAILSSLGWVSLNFGDIDPMGWLLLAFPAMLVALFSLRISTLLMALLVARRMYCASRLGMQFSIFFQSPFEALLPAGALGILIAAVTSPFRSIWANFRHMARD